MKPATAQASAPARASAEYGFRVVWTIKSKLP